MERISITPRNNWQKKVEDLGFGFHSTDSPYWDESAYYKLASWDVDAIEKATTELWEICLKAVQHVIDNRLYSRFAIPEAFIPMIEKTWNDDAPSIYGRFDFSFKNGVPKLLEFNADTPTSLFESGIVQWFWLQDFDKTKDQFNSIHEKLIGYWKYLKNFLYVDTLYFSCLKDTLEDLTTVEYMRDCAIQAGLTTKLVYIDDIGWDNGLNCFVDLDEQPIRNMFKLYPWEFMVTDEFGKNIINDKNNTFWIEPAWKMILSNKAILPVLWQLFPGNQYLLETYYEKKDLKYYVKKPILAREGANIEIYMNDVLKQKTEGAYGKEGYIFQELCGLPDFDGNHPMIGSWIIGQEPAGIGIRETKTLITDNFSRFIPHLIE
jgi:glutathionylspermidine synthase